jgi:hypothetical protein
MAAVETTPSGDVVDDARSAAAGTRTTARWLASALGAIPSIAIIAAIVRAPGDLGFEPTKLAVGVALAAAGATVGLIAFAWVLAPVALEDDDLTGFKIRRVPGHPYDSFTQLSDSIDAVRRASATLEFEAADHEAAAKEAEAEQAAAQAVVAALEARSDESGVAAELRTAQAKLAEKRAAATRAAGDAEAAGGSVTTFSDQLVARERIRSAAYSLKAGDVVRSDSRSPSG